MERENKRGRDIHANEVCLRHIWQKGKREHFREKFAWKYESSVRMRSRKQKENLGGCGPFFKSVVCALGSISLGEWIGWLYYIFGLKPTVIAIAEVICRVIYRLSFF